MRRPLLLLLLLGAAAVGCGDDSAAPEPGPVAGASPVPTTTVTATAVVGAPVQPGASASPSAAGPSGGAAGPAAGGGSDAGGPAATVATVAPSPPEAGLELARRLCERRPPKRVVAPHPGDGPRVAARRARATLPAVQRAYRRLLDNGVDDSTQGLSLRQAYEAYIPPLTSLAAAGPDTSGASIDQMLAVADAAARRAIDVALSAGIAGCAPPIR